MPIRFCASHTRTGSSPPSLALCSSAAAPASPPREFKLATWNLEWFMTPETLRALTPACMPRDAPRDGARRAVPCDVAHELARSNEDIAALRRHARALDADVIALQEVDGVEAARLVFPDYEFCFSGRVAVQNNGFAIRRGLPFACGPELRDLSLADDVRRGVEVRLFPGTPREFALLSVHLKSGCSRDPLDSTRRGCRRAGPPGPGARALDRFAGRAKTSPSRSSEISIAICAANPPKVRFGLDIDDADPPAADLVNTAEGQTFQNCSPAADLQRLHRLHRSGPPHGPRAGPGLVRTRALPTQGRRAPEVVRSLPGFHTASGGRRHRSNRRKPKT